MANDNAGKRRRLTDSDLRELIMDVYLLLRIVGRPRHLFYQVATSDPRTSFKSSPMYTTGVEINGKIVIDSLVVFCYFSEPN